MKSKCINFKDRIIENMYDFTTIDINLSTYSCDKPIDMIDYEVTSMLNQEYQKITDKNIRINIHVLEELDAFEEMNLTNIAAKTTLTNEKNDRGYLSIPPYFHDYVDLVVGTQRDLGNYINKFDKLQIVIYSKNNKRKMVN